MKKERSEPKLKKPHKIWSTPVETVKPTANLIRTTCCPVSFRACSECHSSTERSKIYRQLCAPLVRRIDPSKRNDHSLWVRSRKRIGKARTLVSSISWLTAVFCSLFVSVLAFHSLCNLLQFDKGTEFDAFSHNSIFGRAININKTMRACRKRCALVSDNRVRVP